MKNHDFHWQRRQRGESFFVPCLDLEQMALAGRQSAARYFGRDCVKATPGVYRGFLGVMFRLRG